MWRKLDESVLKVKMKRKWRLTRSVNFAVTDYVKSTALEKVLHV